MYISFSLFIKQLLFVEQECCCYVYLFFFKNQSMLRLFKRTILIVLIDINECYDRPCKNGAQCINNQGSFTCICPPDFTGPLCETGKRESMITF